MPLPRTDVDTYTLYEWQITSAIRPEWPEHETHLYREAYIGRLHLAEPAQRDKEGPPYAIFRILQAGHTALEEVGIEFSREDAEQAVRRHDARILQQSQTNLFA